MNLNIIIRGYLFRKNWIPISSAKKKYPIYHQDFRLLISKYKELFDTLSEKYTLNICFSSYQSTPSFMKDIILKNNWKLHMINEEGSLQFSSCCDYLQTIDNGYPILIIRSDLIMKDRLIHCLANFDYQKCEQLMLLGEEPNGKFNDILFILPFKYKIELISNLLNSTHGHKIKGIPLCFLETEKRWCVSKRNKYYEIYRGKI